MPDNEVTNSAGMAATGKVVTTCPITNKPLKVAVVGDGTVGKTCLLLSHVRQKFPEEYTPTVFDNMKHNQVVDGVTYTLTLWDTAGQEEYEKLRPLSYPNTSVFIVCFSLDSRVSFDNIPRKWLPELKAHCPTTPILLVGTKKDVRDESVITTKDGMKLCRKHGLVQYIESSAKTGDGLKQVFDSAAVISVGLLKKKSRMCCVM
uniref:Cell division control protein 42 homolog n=1 Tax=Hirondellea gigas TaxID=1518452 RepID=A0A6A7G0R5_9CRUS